MRGSGSAVFLTGSLEVCMGLVAPYTDAIVESLRESAGAVYRRIVGRMRGSCGAVY